VSQRFGWLARNTLGVMAWNVARIGSQFVWVVLLARTLGASGYGVFSGVVGLALVVGGFAGLGQGLRLYQDVARDQKLLFVRWNQATQVFAWSVLPIMAVFLWLAHGLFAIEWRVLIAIALAEVGVTSVVSQVATAYAACGRMLPAAAAPVFLSLGKVLAALILTVVSVPTLVIYVLLHMVMSVSSATLLLIKCKRDLGLRFGSVPLRLNDIREGLGFAAIQSSSLAMTSLDKSFVLRAGGAAIAGNYSAAQRFASLVTIPVDALVFTALPRLFRIEQSRQAHPRMMPMLVASVLCYGGVAGASVWCGAPIVAWLLGSDFASAGEAVRVLALYVPIYCLRSLGVHVLLGIGATRWRVLTDTLGIVIMGVAMNVLVPYLGLTGAAFGLVMTESALALMVWFGYLTRRSDRLPCSSA